MIKKKEDPPGLARWILSLQDHYERNYFIAGDCTEEYKQIVQQKGKPSALFWIWGQVLSVTVLSLKRSLFFGGTMFINYLKTTLRNIKRHKGYSFTNIAGLAIGFTCCILILLYINYELNYDSFHKYYPNIYRILKMRPSGKLDNSTSSRLAPALKEYFPEVVAATRVNKIEGVINANGKSLVENRVLFVDQDFLDIFTFPFLTGNSHSALADPFSVLMTKDMAVKYFGNKDPVGETISIADEDRFDKYFSPSNRRDYIVTGVLNNVPDNSHIKFDFLVSFSSIETLRGENFVKAWDVYLDRTYVLLSAHCDPVLLGKKIEEHLLQEEVRTKYCLQSLGDIHLNGNLNTELEPNSETKYIYMFSALAFFIMIISCFNYISLTIARAANRANEVVLRKVVGAERRQIVCQFLGESGVVTFLAIICSIVFVKIALPFFNLLINRALRFTDLMSSHMLLLLLVILAFVGIGSGIIPALIFSSLRPIKVLKKTSNIGGKASPFLRNSILTTQFIISTVMVIATITADHQVHYIRNKDLGYDRDLVLTVDIKDDNLRNNFTPFMNELRQNPRVLSMAASSSLPNNISASYTTRWENMGDLRPFDTYMTFVDPDFIDFYGLKITKGRNFYHDFGEELKNAYIINETAKKRLGWDDPVGKRITLSGREGVIVGIIEDFHFQPLYDRIEPLALSLYQEGINFFPYNGIEYFSIKIRSMDIPDTLFALKNIFKKYSPDYPFEYSFLDDEYEESYKSEKNLGQAFTFCALLSILLTCLGLFSLNLFTVERRTKEIGIRKVLGSSMPSIFFLLTKESVKWVLVANIISWPIAYFLMNKWLQKFAYRTDIGTGTFVVSAALVLTIALGTISYQSVRAASANPADSLRYE